MAEFSLNAMSAEPAHGLLCLLIGQAQVDRASCLHVFIDWQDMCTRVQSCIPAPVDYAQQAWAEGEQAWPGGLVMRESGEFACVRPVFPQPHDGPRATQATHWAWVAFPRMPMIVGRAVAGEVRRLCGMHREGTCGQFRLRLERSQVSGSIESPFVDDLRLFFGSARPQIRPKTGRQFTELGLQPPPGVEVIPEVWIGAVSSREESAHRWLGEYPYAEVHELVCRGLISKARTVKLVQNRATGNVEVSYVGARVANAGPSPDYKVRGLLFFDEMCKLAGLSFLRRRRGTLRISVNGQERVSQVERSGKSQLAIYLRPAKSTGGAAGEVVAKPRLEPEREH